MKSINSRDGLIKGLSIRSVPLDYLHVTAKFDCGNDSLNRFLKVEALKNQKGESERTFVVIQGGDRIVAYYTLRPVIRGLPGYEVARFEVARLAVDKNSRLSAEALWAEADARRSQACITRKEKSAPGF